MPTDCLLLCLCNLQVNGRLRELHTTLEAGDRLREGVLQGMALNLDAWSIQVGGRGLLQQLLLLVGGVGDVCGCGRVWPSTGSIQEGTRPVLIAAGAGATALCPLCPAYYIAAAPCCFPVLLTSPLNSLLLPHLPSTPGAAREGHLPHPEQTVHGRHPQGGC